MRGKTAIIQLRIDPALKDRIKCAALERRVTLTNFMLYAAEAIMDRMEKAPVEEDEPSVGVQ
jgi:uncharacterized protein (DUF1778 family)